MSRNVLTLIFAPIFTLVPPGFASLRIAAPAVSTTVITPAAASAAPRDNSDLPTCIITILPWVVPCFWHAGKAPVCCKRSPHRGDFCDCTIFHDLVYYPLYSVTS